MPFKNITPEQKAAFVSALKAGQYNLLLGSGSSMDASNSFGRLPSGDGLKKELCTAKNVSENYSLQRVFSLLQPDEIDRLVTKRFLDCTPGKTAHLILSFIWKRIFTWNIDDVLEHEYATGNARQELRPLHFSDEYVEAQNLSELLLIHLHGSVLQPDKGYVFSRTEYVNH